LIEEFENDALPGLNLPWLIPALSPLQILLPPSSLFVSFSGLLFLGDSHPLFRAGGNCWRFLIFDSMMPATRSRVGISKEVVGSLMEDASGDVTSPHVHDQQIGAAIVVRQQVNDDVQVEIASDSSDSEDVGGDAGRGGERRVSASCLLQKTGELVPPKVFDGMPQLEPADNEKNRRVVSTVVETQKGAASVKKAPWVNLFKDNRNLGKGIKLNKVDSVEDMLHITNEDVDDVAEIWGFCLVGQFTGRFPGMDAVRNIREGWKVECTHWVHRSGWIVFKFQSEEDRLSVLNGGPYFIYGRSLLLKNMPRCFRFGGEEFATVPVWVQLPDLPLECWNARALSKIASRIGKPITTDKMTLTKERLSFARVMVEVDASKELVSSLEIKLPTGDIYDQLVVFEVTPKYCKKCKVFGHIEGGCSKILEGTKHSAYVPKRMDRPGGVAMHKKGETSGNMSVAMAPSGKAVPLGAQNREVEVTHGDGLIGGSKPGTGDTGTILLPGKSVQVAENSVVPEQSELRPVVAGLQRIPDAGLGHEGTRSLNKMKQKLSPVLRSGASDRLLAQDEIHGSGATLEDSSVQNREQIKVGAREKEPMVVTQGRQTVVRENRKLTEKGLSFASVAKGKGKGKSLQPSK